MSVQVDTEDSEPRVRKTILNKKKEITVICFLHVVVSHTMLVIDLLFQLLTTMLLLLLFLGLRSLAVARGGLSHNPAQLAPLQHWTPPVAS